MRLILHPQRRDAALAVARAGETLTLNGTTLDLSAIPPGGETTFDSIWLVGPVTRDADGTLTVPLILPLGPDAGEAARFPAPIIDPPDGPVELPGGGFEPPEDAG